MSTTEWHPFHISLRDKATAPSRKSLTSFLSSFLLLPQAVRVSSTMDYLFVAAGAGAGVYYMVSKVVAPLQQAKRASEAERARKELLLLEEERLLKRGPNRQAKKK